MPIDFQVVFPQEAIRLTSVQNVPGMPVRTLEVLGEDFRSAAEVYLNDVPAPEFVVVTPTKLLVEVPEILTTQTITSVTVLSNRLTLTRKSLVRFRIGPRPSKVRGIMRLMQLFLRVLFTKPGTDIFAPKAGGNGLKSIGQSIASDEGGDIVSNLVIAVDLSERQIIQIQARNQSTPPDERLLAARLVKAGFNKSETALFATVELLNQAGESALANLEL
jgi:hypothetical protein